MMDKFLAAFVETHVSIDSGGRVWCKGEQLEVHIIGGERKVVLPGSKLTYTFEDLRRAGAKIGYIGVRTTAQSKAVLTRWQDRIKQRAEEGLPSNVYIANARTIQVALRDGKIPPPQRYVGRQGDRITEVKSTVDEVVAAMDAGHWRTEFRRGRKRTVGKTKG